MHCGEIRGNVPKRSVISVCVHYILNMFTFKMGAVRLAFQKDVSSEQSCCVWVMLCMRCLSLFQSGLLGGLLLFYVSMAIYRR